MTTAQRATVATALTTLLGLGTPALAQTGRLTLAEALRLAAEHSESLEIARAGESRADATTQRVSSQRLPQVNVAGLYTRTLASEFSGAFESSAPTCAPLAVNTSAPVGDRITELERAASCGAIGPQLSFGKLPFGQRNTYQATLLFSQTLFTGGRIGAEETQATLGRRAASLTTTTTGAQLAMDVTRAFYDAALSDRLVAIAESGYNQAAATYDQTRVAFEAGRLPEFEMLRAQVSRDNQRPVIIRSRSNREIAYLRLRQLLQLPAGAPVTLDVDLDAPVLAPPAPFADALAAATTATPGADRIVVQQAETTVAIRDAAVTAARAERWPSVGLNSSLGRVGYPSDGFIPGPGDFRTNWSLSATVSMPVFTGRRLKAGELSAQADLAQARAELQQVQELVVLDAATAREDLAAAEATWQASAGTIEQAERAYQIAELRNREGLSTELELSDSRLSLQLAQANRAQAARDVQIARTRLALLPNLPLTGR